MQWWSIYPHWEIQRKTNPVFSVFYIQFETQISEYQPILWVTSYNWQKQHWWINGEVVNAAIPGIKIWELRDGGLIEAVGRKCPSIPERHHLAMSLECSQCLAIIPSQNVPPAAPTKPKMENRQKLYKRSDAMSTCRSILDCKFVKGLATNQLLDILTRTLLVAWISHFHNTKMHRIAASNEFPIFIEYSNTHQESLNCVPSLIF
jgi:hypothetical protein